MPLSLTVESAAEAPRGAAIGIGVLATAKGPQIPAGVTLTAATLKARGFEAKAGQILAIPGRGATQILVGLGEGSSLTPDSFRVAAAALARASAGESTLATSIVDAAPTRLDRAAVAQAVTEGVLLSTYTFTRYKSKSPVRALTNVVLTGRRGRIANEGIARGKLVAEAVALNRDPCSAATIDADGLSRSGQPNLTTMLDSIRQRLPDADRSVRREPKLLEGAFASEIGEESPRWQLVGIAGKDRRTEIAEQRVHCLIGCVH